MSNFKPSCTFRVHNQSRAKFALNSVSHAEAFCKCIVKPKTIFPDTTTPGGVYQPTELMPESVAMSVYRFNDTSLLMLLAAFGDKSTTKMAILSAVGPVINAELALKIWLDPAFNHKLPFFVVDGQQIAGISRFEQLEGGSEAFFDLFPIIPQGPGPASTAYPPEISRPTSARCDFGVDNKTHASFASYATTPSAEWLGKCTEAPQDIKANGISSAGNFATAEYMAGTIAMAVYHVGDDTGKDKFLLLLASFGGSEPGATKMTIRHNPPCVRVNPKLVLDVWTDPTVTATLEPVFVQDVPVGERIAGTSCFRQLENGDSAADFVIQPSLLKYLDAFMSPSFCTFNVQNNTQGTWGLYANSNAVFAGKCVVRPRPIAADSATYAGMYETPPGIRDSCIAAAIYNISLTSTTAPQLLLLLASFAGGQPATKVALIPAQGQIISSELVHEVWDDAQWTSSRAPIDTTQGRISIASTGELLFARTEAEFFIEYDLLEKN